MSQSSAIAANAIHYELRFIGLFDRGRGYAFPCDAQGCVDISELTDRCRSNYLLAQAVVGSELSIPVVSLVL